MLATYSAALAVCAVSLVLGQAAIALCGLRRWSWLSPAIGLALLTAICWATVRLPGDGVVSAVAVVVLAVGSGLLIRRDAVGAGAALRGAWPIALAALAAATIPFAVEGHFGILGTGFNPDMSQHLLAADRLADGAGSQLLDQGYPLGPHAVVVALNKGLGVGLVQGFDGLTIAAVVLAALTALSAFPDQPALRRGAAALVVGLPYLVASYYAQGAFKETLQALFVLAFVLVLREASRDPAWRALPLRFVPAAILAIGSVYAYSFPGLIWLGGTGLAWAAIGSAWGRSISPAGGAVVGNPRGAEARPAPSTVGVTTATGPAGLRAISLALIVFAVSALPELGRMIDFHSFETFDPNGPGLGNLFGQVSPFTALGIWPSGDFRLAPGDGAVPAFAYYLGAAFATLLLLHGLFLSVRRRESAVLAGALAAVAVYVATRAGGTPYTAAKALEVAAPLLTLVIVLNGWRDAPWATAAAGVYLLAAGGCSLLAFANAPVGPTSYSPALTGLRPLIADGATLALAPRQLLDEEQGTRYIAWELRGGRVCIAGDDEVPASPPAGVRFFITWESAGGPPYRGLTLRRNASPYLLWERRRVTGRSDCPLIAVRQARQGT